MFEASQPTARKSRDLAIVEGRDVSQEFGSKKPLDRVQFQVNQGESLVLVGPSGHGKTLVLKMIAGLWNPSSGEIFFEGESGKSQSITQRNLHFKKRGMLFQKNALFDSMTALENVCFPLIEASDLSRDVILQKAEAMLESVGLGHALHLFPDEMSGGMQKRLGIARALILEPPILLNDDPVAGLDPITSRKIIHLILELKKRKKMTVVSVLNDINRAYELADRLLIVMNQKVIDLGTPEQAKACDNEVIRKFLSGEPS